ncbi:MAG: Ig-like domain-containing protein [Faecousia sp.]
MKHIVCLACCLLLTAGMLLSVSAAEVGSGDSYCFSPEDFAPGENQLAGICITRLPETAKGTVMLGSRILRPGDVLTVQQVGEMTFAANNTQQDDAATIGYLPVFSNGLAGEATMTLSIRGRENQAPIAEDSAFETYKNLEVTGQLKVRDPEGQPLQFTLTRPPKRGTIEIREDGSFTYTPKKNKVGIDSFTFTATDPAGKVSREATVTVSILKPTDAKQYSDTVGKNCRFAAEWMKNTGIFVGENVGGSPCFSPDRSVTRGEFVTMLVKALDIPTDSDLTQTGYADAPDWLRPYLAAAIRSGLTEGLSTADGFSPDLPVTAEEAAAMLCSALHLEPQEQPALYTQEGEAEAALSFLEIAVQNGFDMTSGQTVTRGDCACILYQASQFQADPQV